MLFLWISWGTVIGKFKDFGDVADVSLDSTFRGMCMVVGPGLREELNLSYLS